MVLLTDFVHLIKREEGIHIHHLMVVHFLRIKVLFANLLAHFHNGIDAVLSKKGGMRMKTAKCSDKSRKRRKLMREKYERKF